MQYGAHLAALAARWRERLDDLARASGGRIERIEGTGLLTGLVFRTVEDAMDFARRLNVRCIDASAQTYKADCPPTALLKLPLVTSERMLDGLADHMADALAAMAR